MTTGGLLLLAVMLMIMAIWTLAEPSLIGDIIISFRGLKSENVTEQIRQYNTSGFIHSIFIPEGNKHLAVGVSTMNPMNRRKTDTVIAVRMNWRGKIFRKIIHESTGSNWQGIESVTMDGENMLVSIRGCGKKIKVRQEEITNTTSRNYY